MNEQTSQAGSQAGQAFNWKQAGQSLVQAVPYALLSYNQYRQQRGAQGQLVQEKPMQVVEQGKEAIVKVKDWLGQFPVLKISGYVLIADAAVSLVISRKQKWYFQAGRVVRGLIGYYMVKKL